MPRQNRTNRGQHGQPAQQTPAGDPLASERGGPPGGPHPVPQSPPRQRERESGQSYPDQQPQSGQQWGGQHSPDQGLPPAQGQQPPQRHQSPQPQQPAQRPPPVQGRQPGHPPGQARVPQAPGAQAGRARAQVQKVESGDEYVHVRFRNPDAFETIRTPDWAAHAAQDVAPGAEVRTGKLKGTDEWQTESVLIPKPVDPQTAAQLASRIVEKIGE